MHLLNEAIVLVLQLLLLTLLFNKKVVFECISIIAFWLRGTKA